MGAGTTAFVGSGRDPTGLQAERAAQTASASAAAGRAGPAATAGRAAPDARRDPVPRVGAATEG